MISFAFDAEKFRELVLYIACESESDPKFGSVKLNKILYYSDFEAYRRLGQPITGAAYRKLSEGPAPREMPDQLRVMLDVGDATIERRPYFSGDQRRVTPLRAAKAAAFEPSELAIVNETIDGMQHMTDREASQFSQQELGWLAADHGETIPYESAWISSAPLPQEVESYSHGLAKKLGRV